MYLVCLLLMALFSTPDDNQLQGNEVEIVLWIALCSAIFIIFYHIYQVIKPLKILHRIMKKRNALEQELPSDSNDKNNTVSSTLITLNSIRDGELREPLLENELKQL